MSVQLDGSTHPCTSGQCGGGVGRNIAEALWRLQGGRVRLLTAVGDDADGQYISDIAPGLLLDGCVIKNASTATYAAVLDSKGECVLGLGDMALHNHITVDLINQHMHVLEEAPLVVIDGNLPEATMEHVLKVCHRIQKPVFFEPTDRRKAAKPLRYKHNVSFSSPNLNELRAMANALSPYISVKKTDDLNEVFKLAKIVSTAVSYIIVTLGDTGIVTIKTSSRDLSRSIVAKLYPVKTIENVENVSGAGDCFTSGFINGMLSHLKESNNVHIGLQCAKSALLCKSTVPFDLSNDKIPIREAKYVTFKID